MNPADTAMDHFCTSSILVAEVRKPPDVAQPNDLSSHRQDKLNFVVPVSPLIVLPIVKAGAGPLWVSAILWFTVYNGPALLSCHDARAACWETKKQRVLKSDLITKTQKDFFL